MTPRKAPFARRLAALMRLDAKLAQRHNLLAVVVVIGTLFGLLIRFALPETLEHSGHDFVVDASEGQVFVATAERLAAEPQLYDSPEQLREAVREQAGSLGIVFEGSPAQPRATVYVQGDEPPERLATIATGVDLMWRLIGASEAELDAWPQPTLLEPDAHKPPFDELFLPVLYTVDLCVLGFMFAAVMILQDKQSGVIRAFRVGPGGALEYVLSKLGVNLGLSLLNFVLLTGIGAPQHLAAPWLYLLVALICGGMTLFGMGLAVFFRSLAQFFVPLIVVGLVSAMPMYLMFTPAAALDWTWWLPTYHMLFGAEAIMFTGDAEVITTALGFAAIFAALSASFCALACSRRLLREVSK